MRDRGEKKPGAGGEETATPAKTHNRGEKGEGDSWLTRAGKYLVAGS